MYLFLHFEKTTSDLIIIKYSYKIFLILVASFDTLYNQNIYSPSHNDSFQFTICYDKEKSASKIADKIIKNN